MPAFLRRLGWWAVVLAEAGLVAASTAYVGFGSWQFWLVLAAAALGGIGYWITARVTPEPTLREAGADRERWYWF